MFVVKRAKSKQQGFGRQVFVTILLVGVAVASASHVMGSLSLMRTPSAAYGKIGWWGFPAARLADTILIEKPDADRAASAAELARTSIAAQALNPQALRVLGAVEDRNGHAARALALMHLSDQLTRRDLGTQVWLVNHNAALNDAAESLRHYDTVLRASNDVQPVLFPILQRALADKGIRAAFAPYIQSGAPWLPNFLAFQISSTTDPSNVASAVIDAGGLPRQPDYYRGLETQLLAQLADTKRYDKMRDFYALLHGKAPDVLTAAGFSGTTTDSRFQPITWKLIEAAAVSAAFEQEPQSGQMAFHIIAGSGQHGIAGSKLMMLPAGHYRIASSLRFLHRGTGSGLAWSVQCAATGSDISLKDVGTAARLAAVEFDVPSVCPAQTISLVVTGGDASDGVEVFAQDVILKRLGAPLPPKTTKLEAGPTVTREPKLF